MARMQKWMQLGCKICPNRLRIWSGTVSKKRVQNLKILLWSLTCSRPTWVQIMVKSVPNMVRNGLKKEGPKSENFVVEPTLLTPSSDPKDVRIWSKHIRILLNYHLALAWWGGGSPGEGTQDDSTLHTWGGWGPDPHARNLNKFK